MQFPTEKHLQDFSDDLFNYKGLSKIILDEVLLKMELPNCFGIYGNWGSGKSSMIHYIQNHIINNRTEYKKVTPVYFEPWKYEYSTEKDLLFALLNCIKEKIGFNKSAWKELTTDALVISSGLLRATQIINPKEIADDFALFEEKIFEEHEKWVDKVENFKETFQNIIGTAIGKMKSDKLIIFIDDLDRCLPENAVKLLEVIKNFLSVKNTLFILAIDRRIIGEMIENKYGLHYGYGDEYLMKIIQYYYDLPKIDTKQLVRQVLMMYEIEAEERQVGYISNFLLIFGSEPRIAKHYLHQFAMNITLSSGAKELLDSDTYKTQLQYLFIASFLLTKYPKIFSPGDNMVNLKFIRDCVNIKINSGHNPEQYSSYIARDNTISTVDRKQLEEIFKHTVTTGRESSPQELIDIDKLNQALKKIKIV